MAATGDSLFHVNSPRVFPRDSTSESVGKSKTKQMPVSNPSPRFAMSTKHFPTTAPTGTTRRSPFSGDRRLEKREIAEAVTATRSDDTAVEPGNLKEYFERSKELVGLSDGGPPRWFTPLECDGSLTNSPLLLFLPGITGVGLELIKQHKRLGKIFEVWCLHIPVTDQTPFTELVKLVERTIKSEHHRSPNRPIYIVGESFGGCLALAVAASNPDIDIVLILVNPATSFSRSQLLQLIPLLDVIPDQLPLSLPDILSLMTGDPLRTVINSVMNGLPFQQTIGKLSQDLAAISSYLSVLANILPKEKLRWKLQMLGSASELSNLCLHAVKAETLIISSGKDQLLPSQEEAERLYKVLPHCEIRKFNDGGHFLFLEDGFDLVTIMKRAGYYRRGKYIDYVSDFMLPTPTEYQQLYDEDGAKWFDIITSPVMLSTLEDGKIVRGLAGIPSEGPVLLVGYHMLLGLEVAPLITKIYSERDILLRGIAHPLIFRNKDGFPYSAAFDLARLMGAVPVSPFNFYKLMSSKSHVLLYPGGEREALHRKGEEYKLFWPEQSEFVRMAARFNATIIPFGAIGEDDIGEVVGDLDVLMKIPYFRGEIDKWRNKAIELRTGMKREVANQDMHIPGILPKFPGRFYYYFGKPIETKGMKQDLGDREKFHELYLQVKSKVARCLAYLREKRENDPYRNIVSRSIYQCTHGFTHEVPTFEL